MFRKPRKKPQSIGTLIGPQSRITGDIAFEGGLHLDGCVVGNIVGSAGADAVLSVSPTGVVEGSVESADVVLNGTVKGDVVVSGRVELGSTARVTGNVVYNLIEMAIGAEVNGKLIHRAPEDQDPDRGPGARDGGSGSPEA
jgi:cytoskeletal protein CcmA (bactofilin family)